MIFIIKKQINRNFSSPVTFTLTKPEQLNHQPTKPQTPSRLASVRRLHTPTNTRMHSFCLTCSRALYHITLPPRGQSMNLHSERYEQRRRTWSRVHNDCSESVFVMWFVTPSVLSLMRLRDGLWPVVSDEMVVSDRRSKAETRKCLACLQSVTGPRKTGSEKMTTAKTSRYILGGVPQWVCVWMN